MVNLISIDADTSAGNPC